MLSWFRAQLKDHGLRIALSLLARVTWNRTLVTLSNKLLGATVECPCCGWKGHRFLDYVEAGYRVSRAACPECDSHSRHRALFLWLTNEYSLKTKKGRALVFAPERALAPLWNSARELRTIRTDIEATRGVNVLADVMQLPFADESVSLIWCHHVLEQVTDDRIAMRELRRVLSETEGELLISAGLSGLDQTQELGAANKLLSGNRRLYGNDFGQRLQAAGFKVKQMTYNLSESEMKRFGIFPESFYRCSRADL